MDKNFNPQGPRGPRRGFLCDRVQYCSISIHKALAGLDPHARHGPEMYNNFNPQGPRGPRLSGVSKTQINQIISIHKALAGLD